MKISFFYVWQKSATIENIEL